MGNGRKEGRIGGRLVGKRKERTEGEVKIQTSFRILCYLTLLDIR